MSSVSSDHLSTVSSNPSTTIWDNTSSFPGSVVHNTSPICTSDFDTQIDKNDVYQLRLEELREISRERAQIKHAEQKARRKKIINASGIENNNNMLKKPKKQLTKRQLSSKRSAEICRIKSNIYTELLERAVSEEEKLYNLFNEQISQQFQENMYIANRIAEIERNQRLTSYQPGLSNDFQFDVNNAVELSLPPATATTLEIDQNPKKIEDSKFFNDIILTELEDQSSSPVTLVSSDQAFPLSPNVSKSNEYPIFLSR